MIALGAVIALGAILLTGVNLYVQSQGTHAKIQQELSRRLGTTLGIRSMSVTPWGGLELSGITIGQTSPGGPKHFLEAKTFRLRVRFLSLFFRLRRRTAMKMSTKREIGIGVPPCRRVSRGICTPSSVTLRP